MPRNTVQLGPILERAASCGPLRSLYRTAWLVFDNTFTSDTVMSLASLLNARETYSGMAKPAASDDYYSQYGWYRAPDERGPRHIQASSSYIHDRDITSPSVCNNGIRNFSDSFSETLPTSQLSGLRSSHPSSDEVELEAVAPRKRRRQAVSCIGECSRWCSCLDRFHLQHTAHILVRRLLHCPADLAGPQSAKSARSSVIGALSSAPFLTATSS